MFLLKHPEAFKTAQTFDYQRIMDRVEELKTWRRWQPRERTHLIEWHELHTYLHDDDPIAITRIEGDVLRQIWYGDDWRIRPCIMMLFGHRIVEIESW